MAKTKHHTAAHDDETWKGFFRRWHEGEDSHALSVEAKVCPGTFHLHAARLNMRLKDLPEGHPAKRRSLPYDQRPDWWREPNGRLCEGQWRELFALRAQGVPDTVLGPQFGVATTLICNQARHRGLRRADLGVKGAKSPSTASRSPSPRGGEETIACGGGRPSVSPALRASHLPTGGEENGAASSTTRGASLSPAHPVAVGDGPPRDGEGEGPVSAIALEGLGVAIEPADWDGTQASFDRAVQAAGRQGDFQAVVAMCAAKLSVKKAMFGVGMGAVSPSPPHPLALAGEDPPRDGEGEAPVSASPAIKLRAAQRPPAGDWATWLFLGGRGAGKTLAGAMWLAEMADRVGAGGRLALIGPTLHDVREVMIEGVSGIRSLARWGDGPRPVFEASRRRLVFPNGAVAQAFSAEDPDSLRGPQFSAAWADEFCAWKKGGEVLALLRMGLRLALPAPFHLHGARVGDGGAAGTSSSPSFSSSEQAPPPRPSPVKGEGAPLLCITTTPRPTAALRALRAEPSCTETHAGTADNAAHLSPGFLAGLEALYGGTRRAAQEIEGKVVEGDGALFTAEMLARARSPSPDGGGSSRSEGVGAARQGRGQAAGALPARPLRGHPPRDGEGDVGAPVFDRVIVAIDPTTTANGNACGIVAAGRCGDRAVVLADRSMAGLSPEGWARRAMRTAAEFKAKVLVAEVNQGGEMVRAVLKAAGSTLTLREVRATKGKRVRAEPVAALYEQGRVTHAGDFAALEEELMAFGGEDEGAHDLDRADALVWAITDLLIDRAGSADRGPRLTVLPGWAPERRGLSNGL